jgi:diacylglycerol kinase family enzyme
LNRYCIIVNPAAGKGAAKKAMPEIQAILDGLGIEYDLKYTQYPGHGIRLAEEAFGGDYHAVVAAGGDGTVNEVINGMMKAENGVPDFPHLAVLPVGRGNDFSYGMGIPQELEAACQLLADGKPAKWISVLSKAVITRKVDISGMASGSALIPWWDLRQQNFRHLSAAFLVT